MATKKDSAHVNVYAANIMAANASAGYVAKMNLSAKDSAIGFYGASGKVIVHGMTDTIETKEKDFIMLW